MRVLHVINGLTTGGAEAVLYRLATSPSDYFEHQVVCLGGPDWYSPQLEAHGVRVHHLNWTSFVSAVPASVRLYRLIKESGADIVQAWMYRSNLFAGVSGKIAGKPVVWNIRCSTLESVRPATRTLARLGGMLARALASYVINCSGQSQNLHARLGYSAVPGSVIPNGYDLDLFRPDETARAITREQLGAPEGTFVVGCIARWHKQKGFPVLLRAFRLLRDRGLSLSLMLIGRDLDADNRELVELIRTSGCAEFVYLKGERGDIPDLARALDLHVLASVGAEGFPNAVAETMLSGTPNVATNVGDSALIVGDTGRVVASGDVETLANAIGDAFAEWRSAPDQWAQRRAAARSRIIDNFSSERMVRAYQEVWATVARE